MKARTVAVAMIIASTAAAAAQQITPGSGALTDATGNVWKITASGSIKENGQYTPGGGGTAALVIVNGAVLGQDNGKDGNTVNSGGWFTLNGSTWQVSQAPTATIPAITAGASPATSAASAPVRVLAASAQTCAATTGGTGTFKVVGGQIIGPDGNPFVARGINVSGSDLGDSAAITSMFTGLNFIRLAVYNYEDPSYYAAFINQMTSQGRVVEIEHHVETDGSTAGGGQGGIASGAWLASENAFYAAMAKAYAANPYVWFGTTNEPPTLPGLSQWQQSTYNAIRGAGNNSILLLEIAGWPGGWQTDMDPGVYAQMTNVVWDTHFYGWVARHSTDQATVDAALADEIKGAQTVTSRDGIIPAMVAEYGPSTTGESLDGNWREAVTAVLNAGSSGESAGGAAWHWGQQDCCNNLTAGTQYQQMVQLYINTDVVPLSGCQMAQASQAAIVASAITTRVPATPDSSSDPTTDQPADPAVVTATTSAQTAQESMTATDAQVAAAQAAVTQANAGLAAARAALGSK